MTTAAARTGVLGGGLLTAVERVLSQASQLIVFVAAARLLGPAEFGLFALVSAFAILLMRAAEGGWAAYIMAWSGDPAIPQQVLWIAWASGLVAGALGLGAGVAFGAVGGAPVVVHLILFFSVWMVLAVASSAQKGILIRQGRIKTAAGVEILSEAAGLAVALGALWAGAGVLALVLGRIAFQTLHLAACVGLTRARPRPGLRGAPLRALLTMSWQLFSVRMVYHLRLYAATFLIGALLGPAAVGFYRAAERLVGALAEVVSVPAMTLGWGLFRQARDLGGGTTAGFQAQANRFFPVFMALTVPLFLWVAIMGEEIILGVLGPEWLPALPVVALLAVARVLVMPGAVTEPILTVAGEIRRLPRLSVLYLLLTVILVAATAPFGLLPLALGQVAVAVVIAVSNFWLIGRYAAIDWRGFAPDLLRCAPPMLLGGLTLWGLRDMEAFAHWSPLLRALAVIPPAVLVYGAALALSLPMARRSLRRLVVPARSRNPALDG